MVNAEFLRKCAESVDGYISEHPDELHNALFGNLKDCASEQEIIWKMVINAVHYSCQISAMFAGMLLDQPESDALEGISALPQPKGPPS